MGFPSITKYASEIKELLQRDYEIITLDQVNQIEKSLLDLKEQGVSMILGDYITHTIARSLGINSVLILSCEESIEITINQALALSETLLHANMKLEIMRNILKTHHAFFVIFDSACEIIEKSLPSEIDEQKLLKHITSNLPLFLSGNAKFSTHRIDQALLAFQSTQIKSVSTGYLIINIYINDWKETYRDQGVQLMGEPENNVSLYHNTSTSLGKVQHLLNSYRDTSKVVILIGEEGTGKLAAAQTLHQISVHHNKPYYLIDCYRFHPDVIQLNTNQFDTPENKGTSLIFNNFQDASPAARKQILGFIDQARSKKENRFFLTLCSSPFRIRITNRSARCIGTNIKIFSISDNRNAPTARSQRRSAESDHIVSW